MKQSIFLIWVPIFFYVLPAIAAPKPGKFAIVHSDQLRKFAQENAAMAAERQNIRLVLSVATDYNLRGVGQSDKARELVQEVLSIRPDLLLEPLIDELAKDESDLNEFFDKYFFTKNFKELAEFPDYKLTPQQAIGQCASAAFSEEGFSGLVSSVELSNKALAIDFLEIARENFELEDES